MRLLQVIVIVTLFSSLCIAKDVKIHGFVTTVAAGYDIREGPRTWKVVAK